ncbi:hypothetical protein SKDZ_12G3620 [Saccharomyces kudriavzevii ZP591]|nr:hypothetical protein SKDZ_12G3620 [Saccharomyces kudriavzevii ZP591]
MAKRVADAQIQRETYDSNESDDDMTPSTKVASSAVMNRRRIAMPKRRMAFKPFAPAASDESKTASSFTFSKQENNSGTKADNDQTTQYNSKLKALNLQFKSKIDELVSGEPLADLRPFFTKYELYIKNILEVSEESTENSKKSIQEDDNKSSRVEEDIKSSDSSSEGEIKVEGPTFTIDTKAPTSDSVFSFGPKKEKLKKDESDSESDVEIKGPEFKFSGTVSSDVFKLNANTDKNEKKSETNAKPISLPSAAEQTTDKNSFPSVGSTKENENKNDNVKSSFNFGTGAVVDSQNAKPSFVFGQTAAKPFQEKGFSTFGFAKSENTNDANSDSNSKTESSGDGNDTKPSFAFSIPSKNPDAAKPSFTFGASTSPSGTAKPALSFGSAKSPKRETNMNDGDHIVEKPAFNLVSSIDNEKKGENKEDAKPFFSFGKANGNESKSSDNSAFSSESGNGNDKKEKTKPAFSFGASASTDSNTGSKPSAFIFGSSIATSSTEDAKKPFSFGAASSNGTPSFSFGKATTKSPPSSSTSPTPSIPSTGFKFSLPFEQKVGQAATDEIVEESTIKAAGSDLQGASKADTASEESKPMDLQNGEENEVALFSQRAKLMTFNVETKSYDSKGVGEMKLLRVKNDPSKVRLLCRSDGMGNILLNATVVDSFKYEPLAPGNENLIKTPTVTADGKLITYIVKYKQKEEGRSFMKAIEDAKKEMKN